MVPDPHWLETRLDQSIADLLSVLTQSSRRRDLGAAQGFLIALSDYLEIRGRGLELEHGLIEFRALTAPIVDFASTLSQEEDRSEVALATLDSYLFASMSLFIGLAKAIRATTIAGLKAKLNSIDWTNPSSVYQQAFPPPVLPVVEDLQSRLQFEVAAENRVVTPDWYVLQLVAMEYSKVMHSALEAAFNAGELSIVALAEDFTKRGLWTLAALTASRGLESVAKIQAHTQALRELVEGLDGLTVEKELKSQEWDWDAIKKRCKDINQKCIDVLTGALPGLSMLEHEERLPDSFGQAYNVVCQRCYEYLVEGDATAFAKALPPLFVGALAAHEKLRKLVKDFIPVTGTTVMLEPLVDIMELCGYARVYSELLNKPALWVACQEVWDRYLASMDAAGNREGALKFLVSSYEFRRDSFGMYPRDILRTRWQMSLNAMLRELGLIGDHLAYGFYEGEASVSHDSTLIRALCRGGHEPHASGSDVFLVTYLTKVKGAEGLEYRDRWDLRSDIEQEENRGGDDNG